ncbi:aspartyl protease family protein [Sodalis praecaptivus]|uniref:aspartyl protease family protein n=1 Tax=Sodalis praecaptivus TaxID=1239307 RepID=UPI0027F9F8AD|nr:aspartyl protease family protein [Sodalis praecaptivus]CAJ1000283.1 hypothetical protein NVIRENTERO_04254 [Sodalis praecaptivus]
MESRYAFRPFWACLAVVLAASPCAPTFAAPAAGENPPMLHEPVHLLHLVVPVTIAGNTYRFVLDTGASYTVIDKRLAQTLTRPATPDEIPSIFRTIMANGVVSTQGKLGADQVSLWRSLPITLGSYTLPGINPWLAIDLDIFSQSLGEKVDGVLGAEVFRQLSWAVDNRSHQLTAWRHSPSLMGYQQCLPYEDQFGRSPVLTLDYKAYSISMVVDTGAVQSFVSEELIGRMKKQYRNVTTGYRQTPSATASGLGHDNDYLIDGLTFNGMPVGRMKISGNKNDMYNLGMDFFSRFDSYLFAPDQMLFCYNARHFTRNDKAPLRNIGIRFHQQRVEIFYNQPQELARYGLQNGDLLREVNGRAVTPEAISDIRPVLADTPAGKLTLVIERNGKRRTLQL